jgi:uncharacterized repeat protein (TIGR03847 family)
MARPKNEFTQVNRLLPEALGQPGKRTFRIVVSSGSSSANIWLEKDQLFQLALAIRQLMASLEENVGTAGEPPFEREAPGLTNLDFKVGKLMLGLDESRGHFIIDAHDVEHMDEDTATVRVWINKAQLEEFAEKALQVVAAGRPICQLCGGPIDPAGHFCVRLNGHKSLTSEP